jgi:hypothetical protein
MFLLLLVLLCRFQGTQGDCTTLVLTVAAAAIIAAATSSNNNSALLHLIFTRFLWFNVLENLTATSSIFWLLNCRPQPRVLPHRFTQHEQCSSGPACRCVASNLRQKRA